MHQVEIILIKCKRWYRGARSFNRLALLEFSLWRTLKAKVGARSVGFFNKAVPLGAIRDARGCSAGDFSDRHQDVSAWSHGPQWDVQIQHSVLSDSRLELYRFWHISLRRIRRGFA
jgi:hypothetical protein